MLYFQSEGLRELTLRLTIQPVDCTHEGGVLGEGKVARYAHLEEESTLIQASWQGSLWDMELQSIAYPVESLCLVGDQETSLCNHIHPSQVV